MKRLAYRLGETAPGHSPRGRTFITPPGLATLLAFLIFSGVSLPAQREHEELPIDDITASYHFLSADDTLAILDEEGRLKGYIEIQQPEDESDDVLSYEILEGTRTKNHLTFFTKTIHGKYFRFSGNVERGKGHELKDPDYFRLVGDVDIVTVKLEIANPDSGKADARKETVQSVRVVLKSLGKDERPAG